MSADRYCANAGVSMAIASGELKPPVSASRGKFVGMRVFGIISLGRRIQSGTQSWRRRTRASVRFGASDVESATFGTGGFSGLTCVVAWHCEHRSIVNTVRPIATFCAVGVVSAAVSNSDLCPSPAKNDTSVFASSSLKWNVGMRTDSHGRIFITVGSLRKLKSHADCARPPSGDRSGGRKLASEIVDAIALPSPSTT